MTPAATTTPTLAALRDAADTVLRSPWLPDGTKHKVLLPAIAALRADLYPEHPAQGADMFYDPEQEHGCDTPDQVMEDAAEYSDHPCDTIIEVQRARRLRPMFGRMVTDAEGNRAVTWHASWRDAEAAPQPALPAS